MKTNFIINLVNQIFKNPLFFNFNLKNYLFILPIYKIYLFQSIFLKYFII